MKILDSEIIAREENVLLVGINSVLDSGNIGKIFRDQYNLELNDTKTLKNGDIVVFDKQIAFKLGFDAWVSFSLILDRLGNFVGLTTKNGVPDVEDDKIADQINLMDADFIKMREREIIEAIAEPLDKRKVKDLFEKKFSLKISGSIKFKNGKMIAYDNFAVYRLNFVAQFRFYLLMDRAGNYLAITGGENFSKDAN